MTWTEKKITRNPSTFGGNKKRWKKQQSIYKSTSDPVFQLPITTFDLLCLLLIPNQGPHFREYRSPTYPVLQYSIVDRNYPIHLRNIYIYILRNEFYSLS